jgi:hypothetical protein
MIVGGYTLMLYCDNDIHPNGFVDLDSTLKAEGEFTFDGPKSYSTVRKMARQAGWKLKKDGSCLCPDCNKRR